MSPNAEPAAAADSMPLLALDTSSDWCSVALILPDTLDTIAERAGHAHSRRVLPMVDALLAPHALGIGALRAIAYGCGPGSFTGLRIACAIAQGLAFAHGIPLVPVGSLQALAVTAVAMQSQPQTVAVVADARMGEAYVAVYRVWPGAQVDCLLPPGLAAPAAIPAVLERSVADDFVAAGAGWLQFESELSGLIARARRLAPQAYSRADAVARLARALASTDAVAAERAGLAYVRDKVALDVREQRALRAENTGQPAPERGAT